jgi:hypothetical protein
VCIDWNVDGVALPANPKRKSKNLLSESSDLGTNSNADPHGDLIPIPDNLLKKPSPKKVIHGKTSTYFLLSYVKCDWQNHFCSWHRKSWYSKVKTIIFSS